MHVVWQKGQGFHFPALSFIWVRFNPEHKGWLVGEGQVGWEIWPYLGNPFQMRGLTLGADTVGWGCHLCQCGDPSFYHCQHRCPCFGSGSCSCSVIWGNPPTVCFVIFSMSLSVSQWEWPLLASSTLLFWASYSVTSDHTLQRSCRLLPDLSLRWLRSTCFDGETLSWMFHSRLARVPRGGPRCWVISDDNAISAGAGYESDNDTTAMVISVSVLCSPLASPCIAQVKQGVSGVRGGASATWYVHVPRKG